MHARALLATRPNPSPVSPLCDFPARPAHPPCAAVCRVLVVSRAAYASLERSYPNSARLVLRNLKRKAENVSVGRTRLGGKGRAVAIVVSGCGGSGCGGPCLVHMWRAR